LSVHKANPFPARIGEFSRGHGGHATATGSSDLMPDGQHFEGYYVWINKLIVLVKAKLRPALGLTSSKR